MTMGSSVVDAADIEAKPEECDAMGLCGNQSGSLLLDCKFLPEQPLVRPVGDAATSNDESVDPYFLCGSSGCWNGIALGAIGNVGYFYVRFDLAAAQLYRSDGTAAGPTLVKAISPGAKFFTVVGNAAYFDAGAAPGGGELWHTDGKSAGA